MGREVIYLFADGSWDYGCSYSLATHGHKGAYHEIVIGRGWHVKEITQMVGEYFEENSDQIFK